jgi:hypothetical protein
VLGALPLLPSLLASGSAAPSVPEALGAPADSTITLCKVPRAVAASHLSQVLSYTLNSSAHIAFRPVAACRAL